MEEKKLRVLKAQDQDFDYVIVADDEITYNGDKNEIYLDAYKKFENKCIKLESEVAKC